MSTNEEKLHAAVRENDRASVEKLVQVSGVNVDCVYYGMTPLLVAISKGHTELAVWLLDKGADPHILDVKGTSAFEEAVLRDQVQVVRRLAQSGMDMNARLSSGHTALTYAAQKKLTYLSQALVDAGADVNQANSRGETPLYISAHEGHTGVMEHVLRGGAERDGPCGPEKLTPLMAGVSNDRLNTVRLLIKAGCDLNARDPGGWTALWHAVSDGNEPMVRALVSAGADVLLTDSDSRTLLQEATENELDDIIEILQRIKT